MFSINIVLKEHKETKEELKHLESINNLLRIYICKTMLLYCLKCWENSESKNSKFGTEEQYFYENNSFIKRIFEISAPTCN